MTFCISRHEGALLLERRLGGRRFCALQSVLLVLPANFSSLHLELILRFATSALATSTRIASSPALLASCGQKKKKTIHPATLYTPLGLHQKADVLVVVARRGRGGRVCSYRVSYNSFMVIISIFCDLIFSSSSVFVQGL